MPDNRETAAVDNRGGPLSTSIERAAAGLRPERIPVWFMRQAGRSLPEYHRARGTTSMLEACLTPDLAAEITCQPVPRHGVDAAVFFSDIVVPMRLAGIDVEIAPGVGPVFARPASSAAAIEELTAHRIEDAEPIRAALATVVAELGPATPVVGFAGAPFTLAAYLVEGRPSKDHLAARALMHADPAAWDRLLTWCADLSARFLAVQVEAGARLVQLFDSWVGSLSAADYRERVLPYTARALHAVPVPRIHFGTGTGHLLGDIATLPLDVVGVDHRIPLGVANERLGGRFALQGNIDPALLFAGESALRAHTRDVIAQGAAAPGHIVNLGHGVPPGADPQVLTDLVAFVHDQPVPGAGGEPRA